MAYATAVHENQPQMNMSSVSEATHDQTVLIVDDDPMVRNAIALLLQTIGQTCRLFSSADDFLEEVPEPSGGCLVCDIRMPGTDGLELQRALIERGSTLPVIFITGHGDIPMAVAAMQKGALSFIQKPFRDQELLDCIASALEEDRAHRTAAQSRSIIAERVRRLTHREKEVMDLVVSGKANKVVAYDLGVSQRTVEIHRARVMEKMGARSLAELVRMHLEYFG